MTDYFFDTLRVGLKVLSKIKTLDGFDINAFFLLLHNNKLTTNIINTYTAYVTGTIASIPLEKQVLLTSETTAASESKFNTCFPTNQLTKFGDIVKYVLFGNSKKEKGKGFLLRYIGPYGLTLCLLMQGGWLPISNASASAVDIAADNAEADRLWKQFRKWDTNWYCRVSFVDDMQPKIAKSFQRFSSKRSAEGHAAWPAFMAANIDSGVLPNGEISTSCVTVDVQNAFGAVLIPYSKKFPSTSVENAVLLYGIYRLNAAEWLLLESTWEALKGDQNDDNGHYKEWASSYYLDICNTANSACAGYCSKLSNKLGNTVGGIESESKYLKTIILLIRWLVHNKQLDALPKKIPADKGLRVSYFLKIQYAILNLTTACSGGTYVDSFFRLCALKEKALGGEGGWSLVKIGELGHVARDLAYFFKQVWKFYFVVHSDKVSEVDPSLLAPGAKASILGGHISKEYAPASVFNLLAYALRHIGNNPIYVVQKDVQNDLNKNIWACSVGNVRFDINVIKGIIECGMKDYEVVMLQFVALLGSDLDKLHLAEAVKGVFPVMVNDNAIEDNMASFSYTDHNNIKVTSSALNKAVEDAISNLNDDDFKRLKTLYSRASGILLALIGLLGPSRQEETARTTGRDTASKDQRSLSFFTDTEYRSDCNATPLCLLWRLKKKWSAIVSRMYTIVHPACTHFLVFFYGLREGYVSGIDKRITMDNATKERLLTYIFVNNTGLDSLEKAKASGNFQVKVAGWCAELNKLNTKVGGGSCDRFIPFGCQTYRHFLEAFLRDIIDMFCVRDNKRSNLRTVVDKELFAHSQSTGDSYTWKGGEEGVVTFDDNDNFVYESVNWSEMSGSAVLQLKKCLFLKLTKIGCNTHNGKVNGVLIKLNARTLAGSFAEVIGVGNDDTLPTVEQKAKAWLEDKEYGIALLNLIVKPGDVDVVWRNEQLQATTALIVASIMGNKGTKVRRILKLFTSMASGKTVPFLIIGLIHKYYLKPNCIKSDVWVIPNISLVDQLISKCRLVGIDIARASSNMTPESAHQPSIIVGCPEAIFGEAFLAELTCLAQSNKIQRFVWEECHELYAAWRPAYNIALRLASPDFRNLDMAFLSATTPSATWNKLAGNMLACNDNDNVQSNNDYVDNVETVVSADDPQRNTKYDLVKVSKLDDALKNCVANAIKVVSDGKQLLVCVRTLKDVETLRSMFTQNNLKEGQDFVVNSSKEVKDKGREQVAIDNNRWANANLLGLLGEVVKIVNIMITTTPFNGIDPATAANCDIIGCFSLLISSQAGGRVGRNPDTKAHVRLFFWDGYDFLGNQLLQEQMDRVGDPSDYHYTYRSYMDLFTNGCVRVQFFKCSSKNMGENMGANHVAKTCRNIAGAELCSYCQGQDQRNTASNTASTHTLPPPPSETEQPSPLPLPPPSLSGDDADMQSTPPTTNKRKRSNSSSNSSDISPGNRGTNIMTNIMRPLPPPLTILRILSEMQIRVVMESSTAQSNSLCLFCGEDNHNGGECPKMSYSCNGCCQKCLRFGHNTNECTLILWKKHLTKLCNVCGMPGCNSQNLTRKNNGQLSKFFLPCKGDTENMNTALALPSYGILSFVLFFPKVNDLFLAYLDAIEEKEGECIRRSPGYPMLCNEGEAFDWFFQSQERTTDDNGLYNYLFAFDFWNENIKSILDVLSSNRKFKNYQKGNGEWYCLQCGYKCFESKMQCHRCKMKHDSKDDPQTVQWFRSKNDAWNIHNTAWKKSNEEKCKAWIQKCERDANIRDAR